MDVGSFPWQLFVSEGVLDEIDEIHVVFDICRQKLSKGEELLRLQIQIPEIHPNENRQILIELEFHLLLRHAPVFHVKMQLAIERLIDQPEIHLALVIKVKAPEHFPNRLHTRISIIGTETLHKLADDHRIRVHAEEVEHLVNILLAQLQIGTLKRIWKLPLEIESKLEVS